MSTRKKNTIGNGETSIAIHLTSGFVRFTGIGFVYWLCALASSVLQLCCLLLTVARGGVALRRTTAALVLALGLLVADYVHALRRRLSSMADLRSMIFRVLCVLFCVPSNVFSSGVLVHEGLSIDDFLSVEETVKKNCLPAQVWSGDGGGDAPSTYFFNTVHTQALIHTRTHSPL
jgi:hypothetical protein